MLSIEDQVFGLATRPPCHDEPPTSAGNKPANADHPPTVLVLLLAMAVVVAVIAWSISRSVQYSELFTVNPHYQYGLCTVNMLVVVLAVIVVRQAVTEWCKAKNNSKGITRQPAPPVCYLHSSSSAAGRS